MRDFLLAQDLGYPSYEEWISRTISEIDDGYKQVITSHIDGKMVGDVVFQPHKELPSIREIKNLRVDVSARNRKIGAFLLRQCEWVDSESYRYLMADFREDQFAVQKLLVSNGYSVIETKNLYGNGNDKIVLKENKEHQ